MANLGIGNFNTAENHDDSRGAPVPEGDYTVVIDKSEVKPTSKGTGRYLALTLKIVDGQFKNRLLWHNINFENASTMAQQIGRAQLSDIGKAVSVVDFTDSSELHNIPYRVRVAVEGERNVVKRTLWKETAAQGIVEGVKSNKTLSTSSATPSSFNDDSVPF